MNTTYFAVENVTKTFGDKIITADFTLGKGEALSLVGHSGCGKSTILSMIAGLLKPDSGRIILDGTDITAKSPYQRNVGMVFQNYALFPHLNVFENIAFGLRSLKMSNADIKHEVNNWLEKFSIAPLQKRSVQNLSGGEKQRVALARTLITGPKVILFDEPLSALDADLRQQLKVELKTTQKREGYCAVYVTHDTEEAQYLADRTLRLK